VKLSATQVKQAKPQARAYKLFDGGGLFLLVNSNGSKYWRYRYRFAGRDKTLALGTYPDITLKSARKRLAEARQRLADDLDPAHGADAKLLRMILDKLVPHPDSLAKYRAAFFNISRSSVTRRSSLFNR